MQQQKTMRIILGPTASGKAKLSMLAAKHLGTDIISLDSMKIYRHFDIGTAKPTAEMQHQVRFHMIDLLEPTDTYTLADYVSDSLGIASQIAASNRPPLFSGGTALYYKGLTEGVFEGPAADPDIRASLHDMAQKEGTPALHRQLAKSDPNAAARILQNDLRRIVRALEVYQLTGIPISKLQTQFGEKRPGVNFMTLGVLPDRDYCYERCDKRVDRMIDMGLVEEARSIYDQFYDVLGKGPMQAVGYKEFFDVFSGNSTLDNAIAQLKLNTRHFARRQYMWFRKFTGVNWVQLNQDDTLESLYARSQQEFPEFFDIASGQ